jgi:hypothetical protein
VGRFEPAGSAPIVPAARCFKDSQGSFELQDWCDSTTPHLGNVSVSEGAAHSSSITDWVSAIAKSKRGCSRLKIRSKLRFNQSFKAMDVGPLRTNHFFAFLRTDPLFKLFYESLTHQPGLFVNIIPSRRVRVSI